MNQSEFMHYITNRSPSGKAFQPQTRAYKNAADVDTVITLTPGYWEYVEWLEERGDISFAVWVIHCETNPVEDWALSQTLMYWLWLDHCNRHRDGLPTPTAHPPQGYEGWADQYHKHRAQVASITHMLKQKEHEKPLPISVILGSVKELPVSKKKDRPVD